ncbi:RidA family protein, partial [Neisseria meningitidis]|nr:RidA family protein [Neisseria meningitidis]
TPARACVEARLARPEWRVEIKITAVKKDAATA